MRVSLFRCEYIFIYVSSPPLINYDNKSLTFTIDKLKKRFKTLKCWPSIPVYVAVNKSVNKSGVSWLDCDNIKLVSL